MRTILVPVADRPECAVALAAAFTLSEQLSASVLGCHVRPHAAEKHPAANIIPYKLHSYSEWQRFLTDDEVKLNSAAAYEFFQRLVQDFNFEFTDTSRYQANGKLAQWHEMKGSPERIFSIIGPVSDLVVVTRPELKSSARARSFMLSALLHTGRPTLILPHTSPPVVGERILIAWNQSAESAAAVLSAVPLLQQAESVQVVTCGEQSRTGPKVAHLKKYLKYWNIEIEHIEAPGKSSKNEIVNTYIESKSDLLVMGAYSRSHLRERVFGGLTHHILNETTLPTLMLHR